MIDVDEELRNGKDMTSMTDQRCSCCGHLMTLMDVNNGFHVHHAACYGSRYDGDVNDFMLCIECMDKMLDAAHKTFAISPKVGEYI